MQTILSYIQSKAKGVDSYLEGYTKRLEGNTPARLLESMRYTLHLPGKRIRPLLVLATVESLRGDEEKALPFACAIEMIHTYSLIHDDLLAMDNDDFRRGQKTNHKVFGEAHAILAGDALLTEAFGLMAYEGKQANVPAELILSIIEEGGSLAGARGMIGGQVYDIESENRVISLDELKTIHRHKTGDLIAFSVRTGAKIAQASNEVLESLTRFSYYLGLAFQIQDDILDVVGDEKKVGKPIGSDVENHKATYPGILGPEQSKQKLNALTEKAKIELLRHPAVCPDRLLAISDYLLSRDR